MKKSQAFVVSLILLALTLATVSIALAFMPDEVVLHYDIWGNADGWGSKYVFLIFPLFAALFTAFAWIIFYFAAKNSAIKSEASNCKVINIINCCVMGVFLCLEILFIVLAFARPDNLSFDDCIGKVVNAALALLFIIVGNIIPKVTKNNLLGLRTSWSLYNENTWNKSQRWGGLALVLTGVTLLISSIFIKGFYNLIALCGAVIALLVLSLTLSYKAYKQELEKEAKEKE